MTCVTKVIVSSGLLVSCFLKTLQLQYTGMMKTMPFSFLWLFLKMLWLDVDKSVRMHKGQFLFRFRVAHIVPQY